MSTEALTDFYNQTITDLWENYMYNVRDLNDSDVDHVDKLDVEYFLKWCHSEGFYAIEKYLPHDITKIQAIIKHAETVTKQ